MFDVFQGPRTAKSSETKFFVKLVPLSWVLICRPAFQFFLGTLFYCWRFRPWFSKLPLQHLYTAHGTYRPSERLAPDAPSNSGFRTLSRKKVIRTLDLSKVTPSTFELFSKVPFCAVLDLFQARPKCHSLEFSPLPAPVVVNLMADFFLLVLELNEFLVSEEKRQNEALWIWSTIVAQ